MNTIKIGINGFGRIGRLATRNLLKNPKLSLVAVNDLTDAATLAHLFRYDSAQGAFDGQVDLDGEYLIIDGHRIKVTAERNPADIPWAELGVDVVLECTGIFRKREQAALHLEAGAKKVLLSAPAKGETPVPTIVRKINEHLIAEDINIYSNASCTTNCLAPLVQVILDQWGMQRAVMSTVHAYTGNQRLQDAPHKDLRRARAAAVNMIPTSTGAAQALELVIPEIKGKITASAIRVPVVCGSLVELVVELPEPISVEEANAAFKAAAEASLARVLAYSEAPLVSSDILGNPHSAIFDAPLTSVNGSLLKITAWYDNEAGYAARLAEMAQLIYEA